MKYQIATVTTLAWTTAAVPSLLTGRSPVLGGSMKAGVTVVSDGKSHARRAPRLGESLAPGMTVVSHGIAPAPGAGKEQKRAAVESDCSSSGKQQYVDQSLADCVERANAGQKAAQDTNSDLMRTFFKNDSPEIRERVAGSFAKLANECQNRFGSSNASVTCSPDAEQCSPGTSAVTTSYGAAGQVDPSLPKPEIRLCDQFFTLNPSSAGTGNVGGGNAGGGGNANSGVFRRQADSQPACGALDSPGVMLHEMSHAIIGTTDMIKADGEGSYGLKDVEALAPEQNLEHADTYALFAHAAALKCSQEDLSSGRTPAGGVPPSLYGNSADSSGAQPDPVSPVQTTGVAGGRGPRRTSTATTTKTRTRGATRQTQAPAPSAPQVAEPQTQSPSEDASAEAEDNAGFQSETQQAERVSTTSSAEPSDEDVESLLEQISAAMQNSFNVDDSN